VVLELVSKPFAFFLIVSEGKVMKTNHGGFVSHSASGLLVAGFFAIILTGCSSTGTLAKQQADLPREQVNARGLYLENCARCHGNGGHAKTFHGTVLHAQDFTDSGFKANASNDDVIRVITMGHKRMPAFGEKLSQAEIEALAGYVKTFPASP
jgi:mono/diheme cytochrome c family protein